MDRPRRSDCTAGQMDGEAGWWTTSGNIGLPPLARVMGVGRQQQQHVVLFITDIYTYTSSSEEILPRLTRRTLAQLRTNKSPFLKLYLHKVDAKTHPSPLCPLCNIHTHDTHHLFNCTHIRTTLSPLDLWTDPAGVTALLARWTEKLAGGPQAGTSDSPH